MKSLNWWVMVVGLRSIVARGKEGELKNFDGKFYFGGWNEKGVVENEKNVDID